MRAFSWWIPKQVAVLTKIKKETKQKTLQLA
jgi:hypothetical protein